MKLGSGAEGYEVAPARWSGMDVNAQASRKLTVRQAAFIGVGAMVGAGIFSLLGAAGEVVGAAVWLSFLIAGGIALLQGYSFAKFGARYPRRPACSSTSCEDSATDMSPASSRG
jgi:amino acid permease